MTATVTEQANTPIDPAQRRRRSLWSALPPWSGALVALVLLMLGTVGIELYRYGESAFIQPTNLVNILNQNAEVGIIGVGMTLVIILGGIDLSVGSLLALAGGLGIMVLNGAHGRSGGELMPVGFAVATALAVGALAGLLNGLLIAWGRVAAFIATLGALVAYRSIATWIANGGQYFSEGVEFFAFLGRGIPIPGTNIAPAAPDPVPFELPFSVLLLIAVAVAGHVLLNMTRYGRYVYAVGSNEQAAAYSAIPVSRVKLLTYIAIGLVTGLAGLVHATRFESINSANAGLLIELEVIAAVVIGGTRMEGGSGSIIGTLIGVLLIGVIKNMMVMLNVTSHAQGLVMGVIIIAAVLVQQLGRRKD